MKGLIVVSYYDNEVSFCKAIPCDNKDDALQHFIKYMQAQREEESEKVDLTICDSSAEWHYHSGTSSGPQYMGRFVNI